MCPHSIGGTPLLTAWQGVAGNLGMYAMGIPMGLLTDARGPRVITLVGSILLGLGYYPIYLGMLDWNRFLENVVADRCSLSIGRGLGAHHLPVLFRFLDGNWWLLGLWRCYQDRYSRSCFPRITVEAHILSQLPPTSLNTVVQQLRFRWLPSG